MTVEMINLTHGQRNAACSHDLPVGLCDPFAGVLQVVQIYIDVPDVSDHKGLIRCCPGATVVSSQHGGLHSHLTWTEPVVKTWFYTLFQHRLI